MPKSRLEIVGDEFLTSIDLHNEFDVNFLLDRSIYRPMCIWVILIFDIHVCCSPFVNGTFNISSMGRPWHGFQGAERNYCDLYKIFGICVKILLFVKLKVSRTLTRTEILVVLLNLRSYLCLTYAYR